MFNLTKKFLFFKSYLDLVFLESDQLKLISFDIILTDLDRVAHLKYYFFLFNWENSFVLSLYS
jgi:hypothetical protein